MHTKEELTKKKSQMGEQLDLVETISSEESKKKKRVFLLFSIGLTIGLSLVFWIYRSLQTVKITIPSLPTLSFPVKNSVDTNYSKILGDDFDKWEITVSDKLDVNSALSIQKDSLISHLLPQGLEIKEFYQKSEASQTYSASIQLPQRIIFIKLKYNSTDQNSFKLSLQKLIPAIYWSEVQSN